MAEDRRLRETYAAAHSRAGADHPPEETWERLAMDELTEEERVTLFDHVTRCGACGEVYRGLRELAVEARQFDPGVPAGRQPRRAAQPAWYVGLAAAAVLLIVFALPLHRDEAPPADPLRSTSMPVPQPHTPIGRMSAPPSEIRWGGVDGADGYRVEVWRAEGTVDWSSAPVSATSVPWPPSLPVVPGVVYYWKVTALAGSDHRLRSDVVSPLVSFEVVPSAPPQSQRPAN